MYFISFLDKHSFHDICNSTTMPVMFVRIKKQKETVKTNLLRGAESQSYNTQQQAPKAEQVRGQRHRPNHRRRRECPLSATIVVSPGIAGGSLWVHPGAPGPVMNSPSVPYATYFCQCPPKFGSSPQERHNEYFIFQTHNVHVPNSRFQEQILLSSFKVRSFFLICQCFDHE